MNQLIQDPNIWKRTSGLMKGGSNETEVQEIQCPRCHQQASFNPKKFFWESDEEFEFCDVKCSGCDGSFELTAACESEGDPYDFFTD